MPLLSRFPDRKFSSIFLGLLLTLNFFAITSVRGEASSYVYATYNFLRIGNSFLEIVITFSNNNWVGLYSIIDKSTKTDFIQDKASVDLGLFLLEYWSEKKGWYEAALGRNSKYFTYAYGLNSTGAYVDFYWSGLQSTEPGRILNIEVHVKIFVPSESRLSYWHIEYKNYDSVVIENVWFPLISGISQISNTSIGDFLVIPSWSGILMKNPAINIVRGKGIGFPLYPSGFFNMQFVAYYSNEKKSGLYVATYDEKGTFLKSFSVLKSEKTDTISLAYLHHPPFSIAKPFSLPYTIVVGVFQGDWYDAAMMYKEWARKQWWTQKTLEGDKDTPIWLKRVGLIADFFTRYWERDSIMWNGPYSNIIETAEKVRSYFNVIPLFTWRGWEKNGFGVAMPDYFPPTEGWESFESSILHAHMKGGRILVPIPMINMYSFNASGWQEAAKYAPRDRRGNLYTYSWHIHNNSGVIVKQVGFYMGPSDYWLNVILKIIKELVSRNVDVFQLDGGPPPPQINFIGGVFPEGGGTWWTEGFLEIYKKVREEARKINPEASIASEWLAEAYIPFMDIAFDEVIGGLPPYPKFDGLVYNTSLNEYIPLWHAVYHENILLTSSILYIDGRDRTFYRRCLANALIWGEIPAIILDPQGTGPPYNLNLYARDMLEYSRRIASLRTTYAYDFLVGGVMLRPPEIIDNKFILVPGAKSIPYSGEDVEPFYTATVYASAWQASDGSIGIVLTNIDSVKSQVRLKLPFQRDTNSKYTVYMVKNGEFVFNFSEAILPEEINVSLLPLEVQLIVFSPRVSLRSQAAELIHSLLLKKEVTPLNASDVFSKNVSKVVDLFKNNNFTSTIELATKLDNEASDVLKFLEQISTIESHYEGLSQECKNQYLFAKIEGARLMMVQAKEAALHFNLSGAEILIKHARALLREAEENIKEYKELLTWVNSLQSKLIQLESEKGSEKSTMLLILSEKAIQDAREKLETGNFTGAKVKLLQAEEYIREAIIVSKTTQEQKREHPTNLAAMMAIAVITTLFILASILLLSKRKRRIK